MTPEEILIEAATSAWRPRLGGRIDVHPAWYDLDEDGRAKVFEETVALRRIEAALSPDELSSTAQAVLARIRGP